MFPPDNSDESDGRREVGRSTWELSYKERGAEGSDIKSITVILINIFWQHSSDVDRYLLVFSDSHRVINFLLFIFVCTHHLDGHCPDDDADERGRDRADF